MPNEQFNWDALVNSLDKFSADFMDNRNQPEQQIREDLFDDVDAL